MCTLVILRRPGHDWPLLLAANRDEIRHRPAEPPARHWPERPAVVVGLDRTGGGSWLDMNDQAVAAAVMNRTGSLGPTPGKRSRGELVLEALDHAEAKSAAGALANLDPAAYRPFNLLVADTKDTYWLRHGDDGEIRVHALPPGLHMLSDTELDDSGHPRIRNHLWAFWDAEVPDPQHDHWQAWKGLLANRTYPAAASPTAAMNLEERPNGFGTVSSTLIAVPAYPGFTSPPRWLYAEGPPDRAPYRPVNL